jgi:hypothetical protein
MNMTHVNISKTYVFGTKNFFKKTKIVIHMDLCKYGQILTIQKFVIIKQLKFSKTKLFIWIYHLVLHYILNPNKFFGMWINIFFFILWCFSQMINPYILISKVHYY